MPAIWRAAFLILAAGITTPALAQGDAPPCDEEGPTPAVPVCRLTDGIDAAEASQLLGDEDAHYALEGDVVTLALRAEGEPFVCCSLQPALTERAPGLFADRFRIARADEAHLQFYDGEMSVTLSGPNARPLPKEAPLRGDVREGVLNSEALGERRRYGLYTPPGFEASASYPVVVFADGWGLAERMAKIETLFADSSVRPFVAIGVPSGASAIVSDEASEHVAYEYDVRAADYLPFMFEDGTPGAGRFDAHLSFVLDELLPHAVRMFGAAPSEVVIVGYSNGGAFAAEAALRRQDVVDGAIAMSEAGRGGAGGRIVPDRRGDGPTLLFSGGLYERVFGEKGRRSARVLGEAGYRTRYCEYVGGHDSAQWDLALIDGLEALLPTGGQGPSLIACP